MAGISRSQKPPLEATDVSVTSDKNHEPVSSRSSFTVRPSVGMVSPDPRVPRQTLKVGVGKHEGKGSTTPKVRNDYRRR